MRVEKIVSLVWTNIILVNEKQRKFPLGSNTHSVNSVRGSSGYKIEGDTM